MTEISDLPYQRERHKKLSDTLLGFKKEHLRCLTKMIQDVENQEYAIEERMACWLIDGHSISAVATMECIPIQEVIKYVKDEICAWSQARYVQKLPESESNAEHIPTWSKILEDVEIEIGHTSALSDLDMELGLLNRSSS